MVALEQSVVLKVVAALPASVQRVLRVSGLFLAGGFIRSVVEGEKPKDIDLFGPTHQDLERYSELLAGTRGRLKTNNAISIQLPEIQVQFILRWLFNHPEDVIRSFDFTIAQAVVWFDRGAGTFGEWKGLCAETFLEDVAGKKLIYTSPTREEDAAGSLLRVNKFLGRGYRISDEDLAKVVARVGIAAAEAKSKILSGEDMQSGASAEFDPIEPYRKVIHAARPSGGGSV